VTGCGVRGANENWGKCVKLSQWNEYRLPSVIYRSETNFARSTNVCIAFFMRMRFVRQAWRRRTLAALCAELLDHDLV
jgi:hypothetical protein